MNKSIIVLGGSGFLGKTIIEFLIKERFNKIVCASLKPVKVKNVENIKLDILDRIKLEKVCKPFDIIINCTGQISKPINYCFLLNSQGIINIARVCQKLDKKIFHISSTSVYGTIKHAEEASPLDPETPYATCKCFAEYILNDFIPKEQRTILRISNLYGIGSEGIFNYFYKSFYSDRNLKFNNNGGLLRHYLYVEDCAYNIVKLIKKRDNYGIFNLVGKEKYTIKQLIKLLESLTNTSFKVKYEKIKPWENIDFISDKKIKRKINLTFSMTVRDFIVEHFNLWKNN